MDLRDLAAIVVGVGAGVTVVTVNVNAGCGKILIIIGVGSIFDNLPVRLNVLVGYGSRHVVEPCSQLCGILVVTQLSKEGICFGIVPLLQKRESLGVLDLIRVGNSLLGRRIWSRLNCASGHCRYAQYKSQHK